MGADEGLTQAKPPTGAAAGDSAQAALRPSGPEMQFNIDDLRLKGVTALMARAFANPPQWLLGFLRTVLPNLRLPEFRYLTRYLPVPIPRFWVFLTRYDDVADVLCRHEVFNVPWVEETKFLNDGSKDGTNFVLGLDGGPEYEWQLERLMAAFKREDVENIVTPLSREIARRIVAGGDGGLDAVQQLIIRVQLEICERYYGVAIPHDKQTEFAQWTIAISGYLFGPPFDRPRTQRTVEAAAECARGLIDASIKREIERAKMSSAPSPGLDTVLARLAAEHTKDPAGMPELVIRSFIMGMIVGFVPTNTVAAGHILETLLSWPDFMAAARAAAMSGDDDLLRRCLFEVMRWKPLNPGPWRRCQRDHTIAAGTWRARRIRKGTLVLASTQSAMFDPRQIRDPHRFDPARAAADYMLFGHGLHWCAGKYIAEAQITQTMKALLTRTGLQRAPGKTGTLRLLGLFPEHLGVEFDH